MDSNFTFALPMLYLRMLCEICPHFSTRLIALSHFLTDTVITRLNCQVQLSPFFPNGPLALPQIQVLRDGVEGDRVAKRFFGCVVAPAQAGSRLWRPHATLQRHLRKRD
jgi:hypothetical protein